MLCKLCGKTFPAAKYLVAHIKKTHNLTRQEYAQKFLIIPKCPICGKDCKIKSLKPIFRKTCGDKSCAVAFQQQSYHNTVLKKYGVDNVAKIPEVQKKITKTNLKKYQAKRYFQSKKFLDNEFDLQKNLEKSYITKKKNKSFNSSKIEDKLFLFLKQYFPDVKQYYFDPQRYPFECDFYIPSVGLFIELQAHWTHGKEMFNPKNKKHIQKLNKWKNKKNKYFNNAIETWTVRDPYKRQIAFEKKIKFLEIFEYGDFNHILIQINRVINGLQISYTSEELQKEFLYFKNNPGSFCAHPNKNKIILNFQKHFWDQENNIYTSNPILRRFLIENRINFLNKKEYCLSDLKLLRGFKISGLYNSFSFFSPLWIKKFIEDFNITSLYDPCGGWGHRLIGAATKNIQYIYNDINPKTFNYCKEIAIFLGYNNISFYNKDAANLIPLEDYQCVFTCPPYFNKEIYVEKIKNFKKWIQIWWDNLIENSFIKKEFANIFSIVINQKLTNPIINICLDKNLQLQQIIQIGSAQFSHFNRKKNYDNLLIFSKK